MNLTDINHKNKLAENAELISKLQEITGPAFATNWAPRIAETIERYLGKGKKVNDMSRDQVEQLVLIVDDLAEAVGNGL
jgi:hypothetical protein